MKRRLHYGKVKVSYYTELADEQVSDILKSYTDGKITADKGKTRYI